MMTPIGVGTPLFDSEMTHLNIGTFLPDVKMTFIMICGVSWQKANWTTCEQLVMMGIDVDGVAYALRIRCALVRQSI